MLFNSLAYIVVFLPVIFFVFFGLPAIFKDPRFRLSIILLGSFAFYIYWQPIFLPVLLFIILFNYYYGKLIGKTHKTSILALGVVIDLLPLLFFKYTNFLIENLNIFFQGLGVCCMFETLPLILPLGISFFTFQAIAYLVDCHKGLVANYSLLEFAAFIAFWPQLIAGPILHHHELIPQLKSPAQGIVNKENLLKGGIVFLIGLSKKILLADEVSVFSDSLFANVFKATSIEAWIGTISYTLQLYFDFSGYCDMAYGSALFFNLKFPANFSSPYKSVNIQEFWRNWHITLSNWLRDYLYIPLGGGVL